MIDHGITIVISPLLALMNNQVAALRAANIAVATINSNTLHSDRDDIYKDLCCGMHNGSTLGLCLIETFRTPSDPFGLCDP